MEKKFIAIGIISIILIGTIVGIGFFFFYEDVFEETIDPSNNDERSWRYFVVGNHNFSSLTDGVVNNSYWKLEIGWRITLKGEEEGEDILVNITVLDKTENITIGGRNITTRVVEEREIEDGELVEISLNYIAICNETKDIVYFGELSTEYEDGQPSGIPGSWRAEGVNKPGILMPGIFIVGDRYWQEYAPEEAMDRGENIAANEIFQTSIGLFNSCVIVEDSNFLEPPRGEYKVYAPGIGIIADETLVITYHGTVIV